MAESVKAVELRCLGPRETVEEIEQYPWDTFGPLAKEKATEETERMLSFGSLVMAADHPDVAVTKVHPWVVVFKGSKTRCCVDLSRLINDFMRGSRVVPKTNIKHLHTSGQPGCASA